MKKLALLFLCITITTIIVTADSGFIGAFKNCIPFTDSGIVKTEGMDVKSTKQIFGWENDKCVYRETTQFSNINSTITCRFNKSQLNEIVSVMQAYELVNKYSNENIDTSSLEAAKNNPIVKVWQKYLQDSSVCKINSHSENY